VKPDEMNQLFVGRMNVEKWSALEFVPLDLSFTRIECDFIASSGPRSSKSPTNAIFSPLKSDQP